MIPVNEPLLTGRERGYAMDALNTGWISSAGKYLERFERSWAEYCGRKYGAGVSNGSTALILALAALDLPEGSEVIVPSFTIVSCVEAILRNGLKPVLVDADPLTCCMDVDQVAGRINSRTSAVMAVHIYGHPVNMEPLLDLARKSGLKVIEDAAEAHGSECLVHGEWKRCGSMGDVSAFSFYANKNITTGEGGMVLTDDIGIFDRLCLLRNLGFGKMERFRHETRGWNFRLTNMQAAIGCAQIERIEEILARKIEIMERYNSGLKGLPLGLPFVAGWAKSSLWMYAITLDRELDLGASRFMELLRGKGVDSRSFFLGMHRQPVYLAEGLFAGESCPVSDDLYRRGLYLP
ncbi:MAG: DegT/DnrJ/EryC1/StrS family aminotransferase, partial [Oligoflexales bacterium]|nr:DegT/DnrJ/EryC1/StrS family aminotransferase [Oligoflexales bacterium]